MVSGEFRADSAIVKKSVIWPHEFLDNQFVNREKAVKNQKGPKHADLDFRALVIGELNVIRKCDISSEEKSARLDLLSTVAYNSAHYEWNAVLQTHASVFREVENGYRKWPDSYSDLMARIQAPFPKKFYNNSNGGKGDDTNKDKKSRRVWFCSEFNEGTCSLSDRHYITLRNGKQVEAHHICANCYRDPGSTVQYHAKSDPDCPKK